MGGVVGWGGWGGGPGHYVVTPTQFEVAFRLSWAVTITPAYILLGKTSFS